MFSKKFTKNPFFESFIRPDCATKKAPIVATKRNALFMVAYFLILRPF